MRFILLIVSTCTGRGSCGASVAIERVIACRIHHGIRRELVAAAMFELVHGLHEADVAFLDQVENCRRGSCTFGDRDHGAQVGLGHLALRLARFASPCDICLLISFRSFKGIITRD